MMVDGRRVVGVARALFTAGHLTCHRRQVSLGPPRNTGRIIYIHENSAVVYKVGLGYLFDFIGRHRTGLTLRV